MTRRLIMPLLLAVILVALLTQAALALGIGAAPGRLDFSLRPGETAGQTLYVINQSERAALFRVYVEGENADWFDITPGQFTLGPNETGEVEIIVSTPLLASPERHDSTICAVSVPEGSVLRVGAGLKVPARVQVTGLPVMAIVCCAGAIVLIMAVVIGVVIRRRRRRYV